jgi:SAM-dependent methyltransferase
VKKKEADLAWRWLREHASAPYRRSGRFAWHFARGKLGRDPVFRALLERGDIGDRRHVLDIGCGQGLLASLLQACVDAEDRDRWSSTWPAEPRVAAYTGIELMPRDVRRAQAAVGALALAPRFVCADMRHATLPASDLVVILDVLHYVDHAAQQNLLARVRRCLGAAGGGGRLLLRVGDRGSARGFAVSQWVDRVVTTVRGHPVAPTWGRPVGDGGGLLRRLGFDTVTAVPMSRGTPFANVLLVADT